MEAILVSDPRCIEPGCRCVLSKYRDHGETLCAPCARRRELDALDSATTADDRFDTARTMLTIGSTLGDVARSLGWSSSAAACSAIRTYEQRHGLPRAGRTRPGGHTRRTTA